MPEQVLEVQCPRPEDAMEEIERLPAVKEAALFGSGLHVVAADGAAAAQQIADLLRRSGRPCERIERVTPSLEDVFVSLIEAHDRQQRPQQEVTR
jgi:ABC-2 type transport system ATP-binding protein